MIAWAIIILLDYQDSGLILDRLSIAILTEEITDNLGAGIPKESCKASRQTSSRVHSIYYRAYIRMKIFLAEVNRRIFIVSFMDCIREKGREC